MANNNLYERIASSEKISLPSIVLECIPESGWTIHVVLLFGLPSEQDGTFAYKRNGDLEMHGWKIGHISDIQKELDDYANEYIEYCQDSR